MAEATAPTQRMRYSFETRCRAVVAMLTGLSPGGAALAVRASHATGPDVSSRPSGPLVVW